MLGPVHTTVPDSRVLAVVVAYQPQSEELERLIRAIAPQIDGGIVVNNGHPSSLSIHGGVLPDVAWDVQHLGDNRGVGAALNIGIDWAIRNGATQVLLLDQDSEPQAHMVARLLSALHQAQASGQRIAAVGPQSVDRRSGQHAPFLAPIDGRRVRLFPAAGQSVVVDHLITSGCLVNSQVWDDTTRFREDFFIDYVDVEWCLRLRHAGWTLLGMGGATSRHQLGDSVRAWGGRQVANHSPRRHYTLMRNGVALQGLPHVSPAWKRSDAWQLVLKFVYFSVFGRPRLAHLRAMWRGLRDGLRGRMGPAPADL